MVACAEKAVALADTPTHRNTLGAAYYRTGRHTEAVETLHLNLTNSEHRLLAYDFYFLAMGWQKLGQPVRARDYFDRAAADC